MAFKTVRDLEEWLGQDDGGGNCLIGGDWTVRVTIGGNIVAEHPACPEMSVAFCPIADEEDE